MVVREAKYPGDAVRMRQLAKGRELGDIRIQDYGPGAKRRYKVGTFLPGVEECSPGDTPKVWPEKSFWTNDSVEAVRVFTNYITDALTEGWI